MDPFKDALKLVVDGWAERATPVLTSVAGIFLATFSLFDAPWKYLLALLGIAVTVWVVVRGYRELTFLSQVRGDLARAQAELAAAQAAHMLRLSAVENPLKAALREILKSARVLNDKTRITAFVPRGRDFHLIARTSQNTDYARRGREIVPGNESVMQSVWLQGATVQLRLPGDAYEGRTMPAKSVIGRRLDDPSTGDGVALVLIESTRAQGVNNATMRKLDYLGAWDRVEELVRLSVAAQ